MDQKDYNQLLGTISQIYEESQEEGNASWNSSVLLANWMTGQLITDFEEELSKEETYRNKKKIIKQLSEDLKQKYKRGFSTRNLWYCKKFYSSYPKGKISKSLSWTHYIHLLNINDPKIRLAYEKKAIQNHLSHEELLELIRSERGTDSSTSQKPKSFPGNTIKRPLLALYQVQVSHKSVSGDSSARLDLGFHTILDPELHLTKLNLDIFPTGTVVQIYKDSTSNPPYSYKTVSSARLLYTYKANLERIIDGDTLLVNIDLGFSIFSQQRLRLRGLDCPELSTPEGLKSRKFVELKLKDVKFLIIKTYSQDLYGRYLVDVLYLTGDATEEDVMQRGFFLNQEILDAGMGVRV
ncbi:MAG: nuclease [Leptospiraceae bacterium]|nr:nuclease [Leptospiraceae bacterium]